MNIYSHIVIARYLGPKQKLADLPDYYWGAVIPDIRYLTGIQREQTHLTFDRIDELSLRYPNLADFIAGYRVHCLADEFNLAKNFQRIIPFTFLKGKLTPQHYPVILELYHIRNRKRTAVTLSGTHNPILADLGITPEQNQSFFQAVQAYLDLPSFPGAIQLAQQLGLVKNDQVSKYLSAAQRLQNNPFLMNLLFLGLSLARIDRKITTSILAHY